MTPAPTWEEALTRALARTTRTRPTPTAPSAPDALRSDLVSARVMNIALVASARTAAPVFGL